MSVVYGGNLLNTLPFANNVRIRFLILVTGGVDRKRGTPASLKLRPPDSFFRISRLFIEVIL